MENWAIVIGVDQYWTENACLKGAVRDALRMREWLLDPQGGNVPEQNLTLLLSGTAASPVPPAGAAVEPAELKLVLKSIEALLDRHGDKLFFYYAGHGLTARTGFSNVPALLPTDFDDLATTYSLSLPSVYEVFQAADFQQQFFFIDACRNIPWEREFEIGKYPKPRAPRLPQPPQFILNATSPLMKAAEFQWAGHEGGAFTGALLAGLRGTGAAKLWADDSGEYVVRWDNLLKFVDNDIAKRRLMAGSSQRPDLIQQPREQGEHNSLNPVLARFAEDAFDDVPLELNLDPSEVAPSAEVVVRDLGDYEWRLAPVAPLPATRRLKPKTYGIRVAAPDYHSERPYWALDLYNPTRFTLRLLPGAPGQDHMRPPPIVVRGDGESPAAARLTVSASDRLAALEVADSAGKVIRVGQGRMELDNLAPGFYRARLRSPEGEVVERVVELSPGEAETCTLDAPPPPDSALFRQIVRSGGAQIQQDNSVEVSEVVGPMASADLSTILALAGGAVNEDTPYGQRLRRLGLRSFKDAVGPATSGVQVLFGLEASAADRAGEALAAIQVRLWALDAPVPETAARPLALANAAGVGELALAAAAGAYWLSIEMPGQQPVVLATSVLPDRLTLLVMQQGAGGRTNLYQYLPALRPGFEESFDQQGPARFTVLRQLEAIERFYLNGRLDHAFESAVQLLQAKWIEPMAGCLGGYILLKLGHPEQLAYAAFNLPEFFGGLSDSHVLSAAYAASRQDLAATRRALHKALDTGLPIFADGVERLWHGIQEHAIEHPRVELLGALYHRRAPGLLWSALVPGNLTANQPLRLDY